MKYWLVVFGIVLVSLTGTAIAAVDWMRDEDGPVCTLVACGSQMSLEWESPPRELRDDVSEIRLCVDAQCETGPVRRSELRDENAIYFAAGLDIREERAAHITAELLDAEGRTLAAVSAAGEVERFVPNGENCDPVCFVAGIRVRGETVIEGPSRP